MMKLFGTTLCFLSGVCMISAAAFAQSSGNFNYSVPATNTACAINTTTGAITGGASTMVSADIKVSNGNGVTLLVRPSFVMGLFTDTKIDTSSSSAYAGTGIQVCVDVDGDTDNSDDFVKTPQCIIYDQRWQSISSDLFGQLDECTLVEEGTECTTDGDCSAGYTCNSGQCTAPNPNCNFELVLSTLSAHSYDYVVQVPGGEHTITATWSVIGNVSGGTNGNKASPGYASCVGPGVLTLTQTKMFNQNADF